MSSVPNAQYECGEYGIGLDEVAEYLWGERA
jgi:hypothetical protein